MIYPFLTAILPELSPGTAPELTPAQFDELAGEHVPPRQLARIVSGALPLHERMRRFDACLAYRVARIRAERLNMDAKFDEPEELFAAVDWALGAMTSAAPTERETLFDAARWRELDDLETGHEMDLEHLAVYRMRLELLQKYAGRDAETARRNFEAAVDKLSAAYLT